MRRAGQLQAALEESKRGLEQYTDPSSPWHWRFRLLTAEVLLDRGESKQSMEMLKASSIPADRDLRARREMDLADTWFWLSKRAQARLSVQRAFRLAEESSDQGLRSEIENRRAVLQETFEETEACYRSALRLASHAQDLFLLATAYGGIGYGRVRYSRYDEAIPWLNAARVSAETCGARRLFGNVLGNLGTAYAGLGDFDRALRLLEQAAEIAGSVGDKRNQQYWLSNMGDIYQRRRDFNNAIRCQRLAWALAENREDQNWLAAIFIRLAEVYLDTGDVGAARQFSERLLAMRNQLEDAHVLVYSDLIAARVAAVGQPLPAAQAALGRVVESARQQHEPRVLWEGHAALALLARSNKLWGIAESEYRSAIGTIESQWSNLQRDESKVTFLDHLIRFYQEYVDFLMSLGRAEDAWRVAESARGRVLEERLDGARRVSRARGGLAELQNSLKHSRTDLLVYWLAPRKSFAWLITARTFTPLPLPADTELAHMVEEHNTALLNRRDPLERAYPVSARLYETLLKPVQNSIRAGDRVVIVPDGALHNLNFETLLVEGAKPHYWIEDVTVSVAPAVDALRLRHAADTGRPRLLFIGDPEPPGKEYPPLPHLREEREILERWFPAGMRQIYSGPDATPEAYRRAQPARYQVIHFAAHATPNPESPLNSAVVLSPKGASYKLYAKDVLDLPISARLVTVSACRAAGPRVYSGEGLMGFSWAFLEAGGENVIAGLWDVDDQATAQLMGDLYSQVSRGAQPAAALRAAKLRLLHSGSLYRKPFFWAPFELFTRCLE
jgi:CHAT domain-containing protein